MILAESSGNFGQALAYACQLLGKRCAVVMPSTSAAVKIEAVRGFGGTVVLTDVKVKSRTERLQELSKEYPEALVASSFDHQWVIDGHASLGDEICALPMHFDYVVVPVGGGGLSSGIVQSLQKHNSSTKIIGAEPLLGNDAARSLRAGHIVRNEQEPQTMADGARLLSIGKLNWQILQHGLERIIEIPEADIAEGVRLLFRTANLKCEPTGALSVAALFIEPDFFQRQIYLLHHKRRQRRSGDLRRPYLGLNQMTLWKVNSDALTLV